MDIRKKTVIIVGITLLCLILALYASSEMLIQEGFSRVESQSAQKDIDRAVVALGNDINALDAVTDDWASRDTTRQFVAMNATGEHWSLLDADLFERLWVNVILLSDSRGNLIAGQGYDLTSRMLVPVPSGLLTMVSACPGPGSAGSAGMGTMGIVQLPEGPMMIAIHPVFRDPDNHIVAGYFLIGRYLDSRELARLSSLTQLNLEMHPYNDRSMPPDFIKAIPGFNSSSGPFIRQLGNEVLMFDAPTVIEPINSTTLGSYSLIRDISGSPAIVLRASIPRDIYAQGKSTSIYFIVLLFASGLIIALVMLMLLEKTVLSRLALLSRRVNDIGRTRDFSARVEIRGKDEIGGLAGNVNGMLKDLEQSQNILQHRLIQSEEQYRLFFNSISDPVIICRFDNEDTAGIIFEINDAALQVLGYSRNELLSMSPSAVFLAGTGENFRELKGDLPSERSVRFESVLKKKNGDEISVEVNARLFDQFVNNAVLTISRDITDRNMAEGAIRQANKKLNLLNFVTFNDIQNASYIINGYLSLENKIVRDETLRKYQEKEGDALRRISGALTFARLYQDLGMKPPRWQNVYQVFILAISHLDFSRITREVNLDGLEIFADPLLESVFFHLAENVLVHGSTASKITIGYYETPGGLTLLFEDNGEGIPEDRKDTIFMRASVENTSMGLFLAKEILEITGITLTETGTFGNGARFEIRVPKKLFRFSGDKKIK
ncbi:MAG: PAS domain S-box protein [Methanoregula sp.]|nr:PAS domain S-box protein [Methanoregula sp.]